MHKSLEKIVITTENMENNDYFVSASVSSDTDSSEYESNKEFHEDNYDGIRNLLLSTNEENVTSDDALSTVEKQTSDLEDNGFENKVSELKTMDTYKEYNENYVSNDVNKAASYNNFNELPNFKDKNYYSSLNFKKRNYESSSDEDSDNKTSKSEKTNISIPSTNQPMHSAPKRKKLNSEDPSNDMKNRHNQPQKIKKANDIYIHEDAENDVSHIGKAQRMMKNMGYQPGKGLGKHSQGCVKPVEAVIQCGRRGLGHYVPGLKEASVNWNPEEEEINIKENMEWLSNTHSCTLAKEDLVDWMKLGARKEIIDDETTFCSPEIVTQIINSKKIFDKLGKVEMRKARTRSNPFETIHNAGFLNRAAIKMANINKACNFMFTKPEGLDVNELLYFADVCAGPGGFSEYILSQKKWHAKGFGFTLKNENDFTLDEFYAGPCETFHPFYGSKENGDVFDPENQKDFQSLIMKHTYGKGVHFMMSDGGFSVEGQENIQEILSKQLYLCQCLVALMIVRPGGHFVTKLFDLFTPFSAGLVYLMYRCFDSVCIFKPNSSRPANSERYLICKNKKSDTQAVMKYLSNVNNSLLRRDNSKDVTQLVPLAELEVDETFIKYLRKSNDYLGRKQIIGLLKIAAFCEDTTLIESKQSDMRKNCLSYWELPDKSRVMPRFVKPEDKVREILNSTQLLGCEPQKLTKENIKKTILKQPYDWYCMPCSSGQYTEKDKMATFYIGLGRTKVYRYMKSIWEPVGDLKVELPANTLVYAELVYEFRSSGRSFLKTFVLHILDAYMLGGEDVSRKYISQRYKLTKKFCDALWKPQPHGYVNIRAKEIFMLGPDIEKKLRMSQRRVKNMNHVFEVPKSLLERDNETDDEFLYYAPNSVLFLRSTNAPWFRYISKTTNQTYVFNFETGDKEYEIRRPPEAEASFPQAFEKRIIWYWPHDNSLNVKTIAQLIKNPLQNI